MKTTASVLFTALSLAACATSPARQGAPQEDDGTLAEIGEVRSQSERLSPSETPAEDLTALVQGGNRAAFALYRETSSTSTDFIYSPASLSIALAMTYAGARGETATQMADALRFTLPAERLHAAYNALDQALESRGEGASGVSGEPFALNIVNRVWGQSGMSFQSEFLDTLAQSYGAGLYALDFANEPSPSRNAINDWVQTQTNDKIVDLLPEGSVTTSTRMVLTNAVYFNASWNTPFDAEDTLPGEFTRLDGSRVTVPLMHQRLSARYAESESMRVVELPYDGDEVSMLLVLPSGDATFESLSASLDEGVMALASDAHVRFVDVKLPRFEAVAQFSAREALSALGMPLAFTDGADFSGMTGTRELSISDVVHKAFIRVDESGTEAAAATGVIVGTTSAPTPADFHADEPFFFVIRDNATGAVLFAGHVVDPG